MILYLHGFQSSPSSFKSMVLKERMQQLGWAEQCICPQLPESPKEAIQLARQLASAYSPDSITLIGSSLGGYYTNCLAEELGCRAVLLNPVIDPWRIKVLFDEVPSSDIEAIQMVREWQGFTQKYEGELKAIGIPEITRPNRYFLVAATGDKLLDWQQMCSHYEGAKQLVIEGSDHGLSDFPQYLEQVLSFCGIEADTINKKPSSL